MQILDIPIEEIKKLENGGIELQEALKMAEKRLSGEMEKLQKSKQICGELLPWEEKTQSCTEIGKLSKWRGAFLVIVVVILEVFIPVVLMALPDNILDYIIR